MPRARRSGGRSSRSLQCGRGESDFSVGLAVVAFRDGGVTAVGVVAAARMAAAALVAPWLATVADRVRREWVLTAVGLIRAAALGGAAAVTATGGPAAVTYALAVVATVALALFRPVHSSLLPALCTSPQQLTRANAIRGLLDSSATLGGPAAAAILLAVSGPAAVFGACAAASLLGGLAVVGLRRLPDPGGRERDRPRSRLHDRRPVTDRPAGASVRPSCSRRRLGGAGSRVPQRFARLEGNCAAGKGSA